MLDSISITQLRTSIKDSQATAGPIVPACHAIVVLRCAVMVWKGSEKQAGLTAARSSLASPPYPANCLVGNLLNRPRTFPPFVCPGGNIRKVTMGPRELQGLFHPSVDPVAPSRNQFGRTAQANFSSLRPAHLQVTGHSAHAYSPCREAVEDACHHGAARPGP